MATRAITRNPTIELLANELIAHFPERESRRLNNIKRRTAKQHEDEDWHTTWERKREARAKERLRKAKRLQDEA